MAARSSSSDSPYTPLQTSRKEIRLLRINPESRRSRIKSVQVDVRTVSLLDGPKYDCLSYCWGDPVKTETILLNGRPVPATANLRDAIHSFAIESYDRWLWADAICINQEDVKERNGQVALMGEIYAKAQTVRAFLNTDGLRFPPEPSYAEHLKYLTTCCNTGLRLLTCDTDMQFLTMLSQMQSCDILATILMALATLFKNAYWHRPWITQELVLTEHVEIRYSNLRFVLSGKTKFNNLSTRLAAALKEIYYNNKELADDSQVPLERDIPRSIAVMSKNMRDIHEPLQLLSRGEALLLTGGINGASTGYAILGWSARALLKHDYVYAMLSLAFKTPVIQPDYDTPYEKVFAQYTIKLMQMAGSLFPLLLARSRQPVLPSWVVDYSACDGERTLERAHFSFAAGRGIGFALAIRDDVAINVRGIILDAMTDFTTILKEKLIFRLDSVVSLYQKSAARPGTLEEGLLDVPRDLLRTLLWDISLGLIDTGPREKGGNRLSDAELESWRRRLCEMERTKCRDLAWGARVEQLTDQRLFVTAGGRLGMVSGHAEPGDKICVLGGCDLPVAVRPHIQEDRTVYELTGVCYVDGLMDGQALDVKRKQLNEARASHDQLVQQLTLI